ncbi:hypothetical protein ABZ759_24370 [Streptomyces sp. NPDC047860]|uniref:hypothetical protein n=1 Tax=Streptomyces sp. NPDC047860 TaxID=3155743 RepID=UPI0034008CF7
MGGITPTQDEPPVTVPPAGGPPLPAPAVEPGLSPRRVRLVFGALLLALMLAALEQR